MIYLFLSILCTVTLISVFKVIPRYHLNTLQVIVINYIVCVIMGLILDHSFFTNLKQMPTTALYIGIGLGFSFILIFNVIGYTTKVAGVTTVAIASKLSLVIPVLLAFFLYGDSVTLFKVVGIFVALVAVYLASHKPGVSFQKDSKNIFLSILVFIGSGIIDSVIKYVQNFYLTGGDLYNSFLVILFGVAALTGGIFLSIQLLTSKQPFNYKSILAGICLGVPNYGSIYFLIKTLEQWESSITFPINNIGVVLFSSLVAAFVFKEQLYRANYVGILLAILAIVLITL